MNRSRFDDFILCGGLLVILNYVGSTMYWMAEERFPYLIPLRPAVGSLALSLTFGLLTPLFSANKTKIAAAIMTKTLFVAAVVMAVIRSV